MRKHHTKQLIIKSGVSCLLLLTCLGCSPSGETKGAATTDGSSDNSSILLSEQPVPSSGSKTKTGTRDATPICLVPTPGTTEVYDSSSATIDASNTSEGYIIVTYKGSSQKVKLQVVGKDSITYTYNLSKSSEVFPLSAGSGAYKISVYENVAGNQYSTAMSKSINTDIKNSFGPFLYPNQYVKFSAASAAVAKAAELSAGANLDLDVVSSVYNYVIKNVTYDYTKANTVQSGYIPEIDLILQSKTGICLDYAALMTSMLRSQRIPTRLEVGYAGEAYHAWISTYIKDIGWVNGIIEFDGQNWELMDPTFAANSNEQDLKNFIGNGSNYLTKYIY